MRCNDAPEVNAELALFVDGSLDPEAHARVAAHLAACAACAAEATQLRALLGNLARHAPAAERDELFWQDLARDIRRATGALPVPWWRRPLLWASGLAAAVAVAVALLVLLPRATGPAPQVVVAAPTTKAAPLDELLDEAELALGSPAAAEEELEELELDDAAAARIEAAL
jgi:anti-sigma factor RsiW